MKKLLCLTCLPAVFFIFLGADTRALTIDQVKNDRLGLPAGPTIGEAFADYKYLKDLQWSVDKTESGRERVLLQGKFTNEAALKNTVFAYVYGKNESVYNGFAQYLDSIGFHVDLTAIFTLMGKDYIAFTTMYCEYNGDKSYYDEVKSMVFKDTIAQNKPLNVFLPEAAQKKLVYLFYKYLLTREDRTESLSFFSMVNLAKRDQAQFTPVKYGDNSTYYLPFVEISVKGFEFDDAENSIRCEANAAVTSFIGRSSDRPAFEYIEKLRAKVGEYKIMYNTKVSYSFEAGKHPARFSMVNTSGIAAMDFFTTGISFKSPDGNYFRLCVPDRDSLKIAINNASNVNISLPENIISAINTFITSILPESGNADYKMYNNRPNAFALPEAHPQPANR